MRKGEMQFTMWFLFHIYYFSYSRCWCIVQFHIIFRFKCMRLYELHTVHTHHLVFTIISIPFHSDNYL